MLFKQYDVVRVMALHVGATKASTNSGICRSARPAARCCSTCPRSCTNIPVWPSRRIWALLNGPPCSATLRWPRHYS